MVLEVYCAHCGEALAKTALATPLPICYCASMKNVQITLPDDLARDAAAAGLLETEALETLLRDCLEQREADAADRTLVRNAARSSQPALTAIWNNPEDDVYNAL